MATSKTKTTKKRSYQEAKAAAKKSAEKSAKYVSTQGVLKYAKKGN